MKEITKKRITIVFLMCFIMTFVGSFISFGEGETGENLSVSSSEKDSEAVTISGETKTDEEGNVYFEGVFSVSDFDISKNIMEISFDDLFFLDAKVNINGDFVGVLDFASNGGTCMDISEFVVNDTNILWVEIASGRTLEKTDSVCLCMKDRYGISDAYFKTDIETGTVNVSVDIFVEKLFENTEKEIIVNISENGIFEDGSPASDTGVGTISEKILMTPEDTKISRTLSIKVRDFDSSCLWSPDSPFLYEISISFGGQEELYRFGFEKISSDLDTGLILINGNSTFIAGVTINSHIIEELGLTDEQSIREFLTKLKTSSYVNIVKAENLTLPEIWYDLGDELGVWIVSEFSNESFESMYSLFLEKRNHVSCLYWDLSGEDTVLSDEIYELVATISEEDTNDRCINVGITNPKGIVSPLVECDVSYVGGEVTLDNLPSSAPSIITNTKLLWNIKSTRSIKIITDIGEFIMLDSEGNGTTEESQNWWESELPGSTGEERLAVLYETVNNMLHLWRISKNYAGVIIPSALIESAIVEGNVSEKLLSSLYSSFAPISLAFEQAKSTSGRGETYEVEIALTSNMTKDIDPVDVTFSLYADGNVIYQKVTRYDSIKKFGSQLYDVVIHDFSFEMPKSIEDGTVVTIKATCVAENIKMEISKDIIVSGGEPFEASYSRLAVIIVVASAGAIVLVAAVISFINTKRDEV